MLLARSYSHHSLLSSIPKVPDLIKDAKEKGYTTIALTDEVTGSAFVDFYETCKKEGMNCSLGATFKIPNQSKDQSSFGRNAEFSKIALLAKNNEGYKNLLELITTARTVQEDPEYHVTMENLKKYLTEEKKLGFFVSLCGNDHELINNLRLGKVDIARKILSEYVASCGEENVLVELAFPLNSDKENEIKDLNLQLISICKECGVRCVASPAPRYLTKDDAEAFRVILAIRDQKRLGDIVLDRDFDLPSAEELEGIFGYAGDVLNTSSIEEEIDLEIRTDYDKHADEAFFPNFEISEGQNYSDRLVWETYISLLSKFHPKGKTRKEWMEEFPYQKLDELRIFANGFEPDEEKMVGYPKNYFKEIKPIKIYVERIEYELDIIIKKGYPSYFLVFADIMQFCKDNGIVASTRGSAAGSLVGYLMNINILDPLIYDLPFERFLNPMRPSAPDIDGDFADDRREEVIKYISEKYGKENVTQIITFGTMLPRAAVRDVGRVLGVAYKKCDKLAKLIPNAPQGKKTTFRWAMETSEELVDVYENDDEAGRIIDISKKIEGNYRHASSHAAGVVVSPTKMSDYAPIQWDSDHEMVIIQYDMKVAEKIGLVKLDILGIRNLAILGNAVDLAEERRGEKIDLHEINLSDEKAFNLLSKGRTMGLFQLSGGGMTKWMLDLEPERVEDLMAMVALYRPGPMANIPDYIKRKRNPKLSKYYTPQMEKWMHSSYGILVYQDDLLYTVINLAGYDWLEADNFRKGVGKKIPEVLEKQHIRFVDGCQKHSNLSKEKAEEIWDVMVPFAAYGFNKAHACSYGMVAYWTAYMKAEYTVEFMTSLMTSEASNLDKIALAIKECEELGIEVLPPDINKSFNSFTIEDDKTIRYGLDSVKNLGSDVIRYMIEEREENGAFVDFDNFLERMAPCRGFNKRSLEALIWSGSLDEIGNKIKLFS